MKLILLLEPFKILSFISLLYILYKLWFKKRSISKKNLPPFLPKLPILGNIHQLGTHPHRSLQSLSEQYGELMMLHIGSQPTLIVSSARAAREVLITHDIVFARRLITKLANKLLYSFKDVAAAPCGEHWRQTRSICTLHLLNNNKVRSLRTARVEEIALLVEKIRLAGSSPVNLSEILMDYTKDVLGRLVIGRKLSGTGKDDGTVFNKLVNEVVRLLGDFNIGDFFPWLAWISRLNGYDLKADKVYKLHQFFEKMISEHRDQLVDDDNSERVKDFVDVLLNIHEDSNRFPIDKDTVKAVVLNMIIAGTDTSAILLEWTMSELLRHPQVMQQLQNEVRTIMGENVHVNDSDLEQMKYLKAVIKETLRLNPPIPLLIFRQPTQDTEILGYDVPAGRAITINCWAIHRDPISWDEPEKFKPERFLNSSTDFRGKDLQLIPFSAGRRMCPGISLAMANIEFLLANLLLKFDWTLPGGVDGGTLDMSERFGISLSRNTPLFAVALQ